MVDGRLTLVDALRSGDTAAAGQATRRHVTQVIRALEKVLPEWGRLPWGRRPARLPGERLRRGARAGEDLIEVGQELLRQLQLDRPQSRVELRLDARADDGPGHAGTGEQPGEPDVAGLQVVLGAQVLVRLQPGTPGRVVQRRLLRPEVDRAPPLSRSLRSAPPSSPPCSGD